MKARPTNKLLFLPASSMIGLCSDPNRDELALLRLAASAWVHRNPEIGSEGLGDGGIGRIGWRPRCLTPIAAQLHMAECLEQDDRHHVAPRQDRKTCNFILDLPLPVVLDLRAWKCQTCRCRNPPVHRSFPITDHDLRTNFPGVLIHYPDRARKLLMTPKFLTHVVLGFYETFNLRGTKRRLVD